MHGEGVDNKGIFVVVLNVYQNDLIYNRFDFVVCCFLYFFFFSIQLLFPFHYFHMCVVGPLIEMGRTCVPVWLKICTLNVKCLALTFNSLWPKSSIIFCFFLSSSVVVVVAAAFYWLKFFEKVLANAYIRWQQKKTTFNGLFAMFPNSFRFIYFFFLFFSVSNKLNSPYFVLRMLNRSHSKLLVCS